jgi:hypothetical protein
MTQITFETASRSFAFAFHGGVHEPGDPAYEDARTLFNTMIDRRPRVVVGRWPPTT